MPSRKSLYLRQSSNCSSNLFISERSAAIAVLRRLISITLSCFAFASISARLIASCTFSSFSLRKASKRSASSSSMCSLFLSASSRCRARSSSFLISARFVSRLICSRNISRFFAMNSLMFSFSLRSSGATVVDAIDGIVLPAPSAPTGARRRRSRSRASAVVVACMRDANVDLSATVRDRVLVRSICLRARSSSRCRKISSLPGIINGLVDGLMVSTAMVMSSSMLFAGGRRRLALPAGWLLRSARLAVPCPRCANRRTRPRCASSHTARGASR
mmetsp:Transcript_2990/g.8134  ORF Transcript_2990/g.8134 Transcript_2990/m.8134 type:complete len:275 (+) Transcript_2990:1378-2202(+)